jgi:hypothetical protein
MRSIYEILAGNLRPLKEFRHILGDNIKMDRREICEVVDRIHLAQDRV